jgi:hypothetical protein
MVVSSHKPLLKPARYFGGLSGCFKFSRGELEGERLTYLCLEKRLEPCYHEPIRWEVNNPIYTFEG